jgi:alkanesulfonate monooxygenase SsuD/methylene tetrahydromethanopterin reductase-like flavin-dependent oxidoreductase (luciferase family)
MILIDGLPDTLDVGVMLPITAISDGGRFEVVAAARHAEALDFDGVWVADHLAFHVGLLEATVAAAAAAAVTSRVQIGFGVMLAALRAPAWVAKQVTSLQVLSGDRIALGIGVGGEVPGEWSAAGVPITERGRRTDAILDALPALLSGDAARIGAPYDVSVPALAPAGAVPPLWIGGRSDAAIARAARHGTGWLGLWVDAARIAAVGRELRARADALGRGAPRTAVLVFVNVDDDEAMARRTSAGFLETQYQVPFERVERYLCAGSVDRVAEELQLLVAAGADTLVLYPTSPDVRTQYSRLARVRERLNPSASSIHSRTRIR